MERKELEAMTVLELRALAKERKVKLSAGISKAGIVDRIAASYEGEKAPEQPPVPQEAPRPEAEKAEVPAAEPEPAVKPAAEPEQPAPAAPVQPAAPATVYTKSYHNPLPPQGQRYNNRPAYTNGGYGSPRPGGWQNQGQRPSRPMEQPRPMMRPAARFGPDARTAEEPRTPYGNPLPERSPYPQPNARQDSYGSAPDRAPQPDPMTPEELLSPSECREGSGFLEVHPDGYGFLRTANLISTGHDVYISAAIIRRFGLRNGDELTGRIRPQRDSDRYAAMLYVETVNGRPADTAAERPAFDSLTAIYPNRRIPLGASAQPAARLMDLLLPIGFGQRALVLCQPDTDKTRFLADIAGAIRTAAPDCEVMLLVSDRKPEDVTELRDSVSCQVIASTFDQSSEAQLRQCDLTLERAERLAELGRDVVLVVDSLTRISKTATAAAVAQGRAIPGNVNPSSLFKAKRLFGAARALREGGSLTVLAALDVDTGAKVDDAIIQEFRSGANMELYLDAEIARAGVYPALHLANSRNQRTESLTDERQREGIRLTYELLGSTAAPQATAHVLEMVNRTTSTDDYLGRIGSWAEMLKKR